MSIEVSFELTPQLLAQNLKENLKLDGICEFISDLLTEIESDEDVIISLLKRSLSIIDYEINEGNILMEDLLDKLNEEEVYFLAMIVKEVFSAEE